MEVFSTVMRTVELAEDMEAATMLPLTLKAAHHGVMVAPTAVVGTMGAGVATEEAAIAVEVAAVVVMVMETIGGIRAAMIDTEAAEAGAALRVATSAFTVGAPLLIISATTAI